jgi:hypothetical protein
MTLGWGGIGQDVDPQFGVLLLLDDSCSFNFVVMYIISKHVPICKIIISPMQSNKYWFTLLKMPATCLYLRTHLGVWTARKQPFI